jgi:hypothetical protein
MSWVDYTTKTIKLHWKSIKKLLVVHCVVLQQDRLKNIGQTTATSPLQMTATCMQARDGFQILKTWLFARVVSTIYLAFRSISILSFPRLHRYVICVSTRTIQGCRFEGLGYVRSLSNKKKLVWRVLEPLILDRDSYF